MLTWLCDGCGSKVTRTVNADEAHLMRCCSRPCRRRARLVEQARQRQIAQDLAAQPGTALCPRPDKRVFPSMEQARLFLWSNYREDRNVDAYRCACGGVHVGHDSTRRGRNPLLVRVVEHDAIGGILSRPDMGEAAAL